MKQDRLNSFMQEIENIALEYKNIAVLPELSDIQSQRLGEILEHAISCPELDLKISEVNHQVSKDLGLLDEENCKSYKDQQALLREYLGCNISCLPSLSNNIAENVDQSSLMSSNLVLQRELILNKP